MKTEALRCDYCSGFVDPKTYKCPYCGTQYVKPKDDWIDFCSPLTTKVLAVQAPVEVISACQEISMYDYKMMQDIGMPI
jgi:DNA-directed RNA polymerase subunit RPC12/RpoP